MEGNQMKMREALETCRRVIHCAIIAGILRGDDAYDALDKAKAALSAPARNCDVGTAEEQESRYERFCDAHKWVDDEGVNECLSDCPLYRALDCALRWAQMPYEAEEGVGDGR